MGNVIKKVVIGLIVGGALFGITRALEFPTVFQWMFFAYAILGTAVFVLLDAPSLKPVGGVKALGALFDSSRTPSMVMPLSTALSMS